MDSMRPASSSATGCRLPCPAGAGKGVAVAMKLSRGSWVDARMGECVPLAGLDRVVRGAIVGAAPARTPTRSSSTSATSAAETVSSCAMRSIRFGRSGCVGLASRSPNCGLCRMRLAAPPQTAQSLSGGMSSAEPMLA